MGFDSRPDRFEAKKYERVADKKKRLENEEKQAAFAAKLDAAKAAK
jgi:hypothetical protein